MGDERAAWFFLCLLGQYVLGCAAGQAGATREPGSYADVDAIITDTCARQTCHGTLVANARMDLMAKDGWRSALVGVPSCEYDRMQRVAPGHPEQSWIMIKLAGPKRFREYMDFVDFVPDADWKPSIPECSSIFDDGAPWFGTPMPPPDTTHISSEQIERIRAWIEAGAPGPD